MSETKEPVVIEECYDRERKGKTRPTCTILIGESGSGKSTLAKWMVDNDPKKNTVRINRDDIRSMLHLSSGARELESFVIDSQQELMRRALLKGYNVIVDDTNLNPRTQDRVANIAENYGASVVRHRMETDLWTCILNDSSRTGRAKVGQAVIERQFLASGRIKLDTNKPIVLVDLDGTLAQNSVNRNVYDESKVHLDPVYPEIVKWVQGLHEGRVCEGNPNGLAHTVLIVSGRHSTCGEDSIEWLVDNDIPFHHIFMRHGWDNRKDTIVKKEILDEILLNVSKEQIAFVIDDRPSVLNMWFDNGIKIYPAREIKEPF